MSLIMHCTLLQSPERLQARLEELAGGVEKERGLVSEAERRSRDLQARMDTIAKASLVLQLYQCFLNQGFETPISVH